MLFVLHQYGLHPFQLGRQHAELMNLRLERQIVLSVNESIHKLPPLRVCLEVVELLGCIGGFAIEGIYR